MKKTLLLNLLIILLYSCKPNKKQTIANNELVIGDINNKSVIYTEFNPSILVKGERHGTDTDYNYSDSVEIDLNFDGISDIEFNFQQEFYEPSCDCEGIDCCMPWDSSYCIVKLLTNVEFACTNNNDFLQPARLTYGDTISKNLNWNQNDKRFLITAWGMNNHWYNSEPGYLGFRIIESSDTLFGWIKINTYQAGQIEVFESVVETKNIK